MALITEPAGLLAYLVYASVAVMTLAARKASRPLGKGVSTRLISLVTLAGIAATAQRMLSLLGGSSKGTATRELLDPLVLVQQGILLSAFHVALPTGVIALLMLHRPAFLPDASIASEPPRASILFTIMFLSILFLILELLVSTTLVWLAVSISAFACWAIVGRSACSSVQSTVVRSLATVAPFLSWFIVFSPHLSLNWHSGGLHVDSLLKEATLESPPFWISRVLTLAAFGYAAALLSRVTGIPRSAPTASLAVGMLFALLAVGWKVYHLAGNVSHASLWMWLVTSLEELSIVSLVAAHAGLVTLLPILLRDCRAHS